MNNINEQFEKRKLDNIWKFRKDTHMYHIYCIGFENGIEIGFSGNLVKLTSMRLHKNLYVTDDIEYLFSSSNYELIKQIYIDSLKLDIIDSNYLCDKKSFKKLKTIFEILR